jgi:hypothetical protein
VAGELDAQQFGLVVQPALQFVGAGGERARHLRQQHGAL